jgi:hypothetical protein
MRSSPKIAQDKNMTSNKEHVLTASTITDHSTSSRNQGTHDREQRCGAKPPTPGPHGRTRRGKILPDLDRGSKKGVVEGDDLDLAANKKDEIIHKSEGGVVRDMQTAKLKEAIWLGAAFEVALVSVTEGLLGWRSLGLSIFWGPCRSSIQGVATDLQGR